MATAQCERCGRALCEVHVRAMPPTPHGISEDAVGRFTLAVRSPQELCESCRAELGHSAIAQSLGAPRSELPDHWLDRAIALSSDHSRSEAEKLNDAALPPSLTPTEVAREFLRRIEKQPVESVPIGPTSWLRPPDYVSGWTVDCRRTEYKAAGVGERYKLPCLISTDGELLGPLLEEGDRQGPTWWVVPESDIELHRLVNGVAHILVLSTFAA